MNSEKPKEGKTYNNKVTAPIFYLTNDPERALGLERLLPNFHVVCIDHNPMVDAMLLQEIKVFSLAGELQEDRPIYRNTNRLLQHTSVQRYIEQNTPNNEIPNIMVFKIAPNIEKTAEKLGYRLLNTPAKLNRRFEGKISQYEVLSKVDVRFPKTVIGRMEELSYDNLKNKLGKSFILQFDRGHTGLGTLFISSANEYADLQTKFPRRKIRVAEHITGKAWTINAAISPYGIAYGGLSYQITGLKGFTEQVGGTVGNDWSKVDELSESSINQIETETKKIGATMETDGYFGLFGIDFVITDEGEVYVIEVNARQPASTGMHTKLMLRENQIPLMLMHIAHFMTENTEEYDEFIRLAIGYAPNVQALSGQNSEGLKAIHASQVIARKLETGDSILAKAIPGVYRGDERVGNGISIQDLSNKGDYLLSKQYNYDLIKTGYEVCRVQSLKTHEEVIEFMNNLHNKS